jgi:cytochrome c-type biogenesis protein CcmH/NrfG
VNAQAIDPTLVTSLVVALGLAILFLAKWRAAEAELQPVKDESDEQRRRAWRAEDEVKALRLALDRKVAAEVDNGGDSGPGEAA